jgi:hypothetical protein
MIALGQGIGKTLGGGSPAIIKRFGKDCERYSVNIKGLEPQADPRDMRLTPEMLGHIVNPRGATKQPAQSCNYRVDPGFSQD